MARGHLRREDTGHTLTPTTLSHEPWFRLAEPGAQPDRGLAAVHEALLALEAADPRAAKAVELRFFGGLELTELAEAIEARAWPP